MDESNKERSFYFFFSFQDRAHKDEKDFRRHANIQELVTLKESEKHLQQELERTKELLKLEQQNHRETIAKVFEQWNDTLAIEGAYLITLSTIV